MVNWNRVNNELSVAVCDSGRVDELLAGLWRPASATRSGRAYRGPCPVDRGEDSNFELRTDGGVVPIHWRCYSNNCQRNGPLKNNLLGLVRGALAGDAHHPASLSDAVEYIQSFLARAGVTPRTPSSPNRPARHTVSRPQWTREQVRSRLDIPSPYFLARGFGAAVLDEFDVGESAKWGRAVVPVYDDAGGRCVGVASRSVHPLCESCKYCHPPEYDCFLGELRWELLAGYSRSEWLYNYSRAKHSSSPFVLLAEGAPDVLRAAEAGIPAVAALGTDLLVRHVDKLKALGREVVVAFDNDESGRKAAAAVAVQLGREGIRASVRHPPSGTKDVGEMAPGEVARWYSPAE